ncbi:MAG TPA: hypothetical protein VK066_29745 [Chloroflexota bacterium]|nr:hypothetical protein [Chloroflexota bacterium]
MFVVVIHDSEQRRVQAALYRMEAGSELPQRTRVISQLYQLHHVAAFAPLVADLAATISSRG